MAKVKISAEKEVEVPDELAPLVADETGVPYKNRAAEFRRKLERLEKRLAALEDADDDAPTKGAAPPQNGGAGASQPQPQPQVQPQAQVQWYYDPQTGQYYGFDGQRWYVYPYNSFTHAVAPGPGVSTATPQPAPAPSAEKVAEEAAKKVRQDLDMERELDLLRKEWPGMDDEEEVEKLNDFLKSQGYDDKEIERMSPRDIRLAVRAWRAAKSGEGAGESGGEGGPKAPVVLDSGAAQTPRQPLFRDPERIRSLPKRDFNELVERVKMSQREV